MKPSELENEVNKYLMNYLEDIQDGVIETADDITKKAINELKETSPKGKGKNSKPYYKGWSSQKNNQKNRYTIKIWNKTNYQLTHLLEFGHATRNGQRSKAIPHIRPVEEKYKELFDRQLTTVIKRRSKK